MTAPHDHVPLRDHWWPRPGWRPGRIALTWHLVFRTAPRSPGTWVVRPPTTVPVTEVTLIRQERLLAPHWQYRWTVEAVAQLGAPPSVSAGHREIAQQLDL